MSKETANKFLKSLESDSLLKSKFDDLLNNISGLTKEEQAEKIIEFAKKQGYEIDKSDFKNIAFSGDSGELSDDELLNVAGGISQYQQAVINDYIGCGNNNIANSCSNRGRSAFVEALMNK